MTETLEAVRSELRTMREQKRVPLSPPPVSLAAELMAKLPAEAAVTADVISNMNKLFDSLNSDSSALRRDELFGAVRAENPDLTDSEWQLLLTLLQSEGLHQANGLIKLSCPAVTSRRVIYYTNKESLMKMWEKLKSDSKKNYVQLKNNTTQTWGGPLVLKIDPVLEQVCAILGRRCTGVLGVSDCDAETGQDTEKVHFKVICTQNKHKKAQVQIYEWVIDENLAEEPKVDNKLQKTPINKTPLWSRRRPQISSTNERNEATSSVSNSIQNVYKKREPVEDLKEILLRAELQFQRNLYELQLEAAAR
ncbi:hypothetical protein ACJJTC_001193 [Scirpophaga incertulas]